MTNGAQVEMAFTLVPKGTLLDPQAAAVYTVVAEKVPPHPSSGSGPRASLRFTSGTVGNGYNAAPIDAVPSVAV